jgi:hypothetical protein
MNDLIRRSELKQHINSLSSHWLCEWDTLGVLAAIDSIPAVDAVEVKHARWIPHPDKEVRDYDCCTWCGTGTKRREYGFNPDGREYVTEYSFRYCPWCGARMDGRREEDGDG